MNQNTLRLQMRLYYLIIHMLMNHLELNSSEPHCMVSYVNFFLAHKSMGLYFLCFSFNLDTLKTMKTK